jgi:fucose 4-O-acetylase-like acetyltransferase
MAMMPMGYAWCRWGPGEVGFSPLIQLGKTSLLVYWVHIIFVYGRLSIFPKRMQTVPVATLGILIVTLAMLALSIVRTRSEGRGPQIRAWFRQKMGIAART